MIKLSTKQKREIYSLSSLLLHLLVFAILLISLNSCTQKEDAPIPACNNIATVIDMRHLGGCGFMLKMDNGVLLLPIYPNRGWCGTVAPEQKTPIEKFELKEGQRVIFGFTDAKNTVSVCNMGQPVEITCIKETDLINCWPTNTAPALPN